MLQNARQQSVYSRTCVAYARVVRLSSYTSCKFESVGYTGCYRNAADGMSFDMRTQKVHVRAKFDEIINLFLL